MLNIARFDENWLKQSQSLDIHLQHLILSTTFYQFSKVDMLPILEHPWVGRDQEVSKVKSSPVLSRPSSPDSPSCTLSSKYPTMLCFMEVRFRFFFNLWNYNTLVEKQRITSSFYPRLLGVRLFTSYVKEVHGGVFRRVALSGLIDSAERPHKRRPKTQTTRIVRL